jgi:hypothetical protein
VGSRHRGANRGHCARKYAKALRQISLSKKKWRGILWFFDLNFAWTAKKVPGDFFGNHSGFWICFLEIFNGCRKKHRAPFGCQWASGNIHIPSNSAMVQLHHKNWHDKSIEDARLNPDNSLHFTSVYSVSQDDFALKEPLLRKKKNSSA